MLVPSILEVRLRTYVIVSFQASERDAMLERLAAAGFERDAAYGEFDSSSPQRPDLPNRVIVAGWVDGEDGYARAVAVEGASVRREKDVDPFLQRARGGFAY